MENDAIDLVHEFKIWIYFHPGGDGTSRLMGVMVGKPAPAGSDALSA